MECAGNEGYSERSGTDVAPAPTFSGGGDGPLIESIRSNGNLTVASEHAGVERKLMRKRRKFSQH
jgi:hypothetical protein